MKGGGRLIYMENQATQRYYLLFIEQDLFDTWCLIRAFGSTVTKRGRTIVQICENEQQAEDELAKVEAKRHKRGYESADMLHDPHFYLRPLSASDGTLMAGLSEIVPKPIKSPRGRIVKIHPDQMGLFG